MKIYAVVVTLVAVLALSVVGYGVWAGNKLQTSLNKLESNLHQTQNELSGLKITNQKLGLEIQTLNKILRASSNSLVHPGDLKISSFNAGSVDEINSNIEKIADQHVRAKVKSDWENFVNSKTLNDYRQFIQSVSDAISNDAASFE